MSQSASAPSTTRGRSDTRIDRATFGGDRPDRFAASDAIALAWAALAHHGGPQHSAIPLWNAFDRSGRAMMRIGAPWERAVSPETSAFPASPLASW